MKQPHIAILMSGDTIHEIVATIPGLVARVIDLEAKPAPLVQDGEIEWVLDLKYRDIEEYTHHRLSKTAHPANGGREDFPLDPLTISPLYLSSTLYKEEE